MKKIIHKLAKISGFNLVPIKNSFAKDMENDFRSIYLTCDNYTMTSLNSMYSLYKAAEYIVKAGIPGDIVECGVWKGGSAMLAAKTLSFFNDTSKKIYLYDTFEGMPKPDDVDVKIRTGASGKDIWQQKQKDGGWAKAKIDEVKQNMHSTAYPTDNLIFVKGKVEDTIPKTKPGAIALLRLDTDWFSSTYHELKHLYPLLSPGGVLIIDDYGSWSGSKKAVDQYFTENNINIYLHRTDTGRVGIKS